MVASEEGIVLDKRWKRNAPEDRRSSVTAPLFNGKGELCKNYRGIRGIRGITIEVSVVVKI